MTGLIRSLAVTAALFAISVGAAQAQSSLDAGAVAPSPDAKVAASRAPTPSAVAPVPAVETEQYRIGPEDVLEILVWKNPDLTRTVVVRADFFKQWQHALRAIRGPCGELSMAVAVQRSAAMGGYEASVPHAEKGCS